MFRFYPALRRSRLQGARSGRFRSGLRKSPVCRLPGFGKIRTVPPRRRRITTKSLAQSASVGRQHGVYQGLHGADVTSGEQRVERCLESRCKSCVHCRQRPWKCLARGAPVAARAQSEVSQRKVERRGGSDEHARVAIAVQRSSEISDRIPSHPKVVGAEWRWPEPQHFAGSLARCVKQGRGPGQGGNPIGHHGGQDGHSGSPIHLPTEIGHRARVVREHLHVPALEEDRLPPRSVRQGGEQKNDIVIGAGGCLTTRLRAREQSRFGRRMLTSDEAANEAERVGHSGASAVLRAVPTQSFRVRHRTTSPT
jgi:hypothetical protein